jgi:hypothetical protein
MELEYLVYRCDWEGMWWLITRHKTAEEALKACDILNGKLQSGTDPDFYFVEVDYA